MQYLWNHDWLLMSWEGVLATAIIMIVVIAVAAIIVEWIFRDKEK